MKYISKDYVMQEIIDTAYLMQLNNEPVPEIDPTYMDLLIEEFLFDWNEIGDPYGDWEGTLRSFLREEFKNNTIKNAN